MKNTRNFHSGYYFTHSISGFAIQALPPEAQQWYKGVFLHIRANTYLVSISTYKTQKKTKITDLFCIF